MLENVGVFKVEAIAEDGSFVAISSEVGEDVFYSLFELLSVLGVDDAALMVDFTSCVGGFNDNFYCHSTLVLMRPDFAAGSLSLATEASCASRAEPPGLWLLWVGSDSVCGVAVPRSSEAIPIFCG